MLQISLLGFVLGNTRVVLLSFWFFHKDEIEFLC